MTSSTLDQALARVQSYYAQPSATFGGEPPSIESLKAMKMIKALAFSIEAHGRVDEFFNFRIVGPSGIGKTQTAKAMARAFDLDYCYLNGGNMSAENIGLPTIQSRNGRETIVWAIIKKYVEKGGKVIIVDEPGQGDAGFRSALMEMTTRATFGDVALTDLVAVWMLDNPANDSYQDLAGIDIAQSDRMGTVFIDSADVPWEHGLALRFPHLDLKPVYREYHTLNIPEDSYEILSPRVLEHIIFNLDKGLNGNLGRPIMFDRYIPVADVTGSDIAEEIVDRVASALHLPNPPRTADDFDKAVRLIASDGIDVIAYGTQGIGKTERSEALLGEMGINVAYKSLPTITKEDINLSVVSEDGLNVEVITHHEFTSPEPTVAIWDEVGRGKARTRNAVMELVQEHTSGGVPLPNLRGSLMLTNLAKSGEFGMDVEEVSLPFATRPDINIIVTVEDMHSIEWLIGKYGRSITPFTDWFHQDLGAHPNLQEWASPRFIKRAYHYHQGGVDIRWALPAPDDEYVALPLATLYARLRGTEMVTFYDIVDHLDDYVERLSKRDSESGGFADRELHMAVYNSIINADVLTLRENSETVLRVFSCFGEDHRMQLMRMHGPKFDLLIEILLPLYTLT
jgi:hypothetical protein